MRTLALHLAPDFYFFVRSDGHYNFGLSYKAEPAYIYFWYRDRDMLKRWYPEHVPVIEAALEELSKEPTT